MCRGMCTVALPRLVVVLAEAVQRGGTKRFPIYQSIGQVQLKRGAEATARSL